MLNIKMPRHFSNFLLALLLWSGHLNAAIDVYEFNDDADTRRFQELTTDLRCPKCQNQNIADSNAEIARDLRQKIYEMLGAGRSNDEIIDYMVERYGDFVLYEPRIDEQTYLLWYGPALLLLIGLLATFWIARSSLRASRDDDATLNDEQRKQLQELLKDDKNHD